MSTIVLTKARALSASGNGPASPAIQARELQQFSGATLMDDVFFAGIVVAIFGLVLAVFSSTLVKQWDKAPVAAVAIAGSPMQQQVKRPLLKTSVKGDVRPAAHQAMRRT